jgi:hypothetical protein
LYVCPLSLALLIPPTTFLVEVIILYSGPVFNY